MVNGPLSCKALYSSHPVTNIPTLLPNGPCFTSAGPFGPSGPKSNLHCSVFDLPPDQLDQIQLCKGEAVWACTSRCGVCSHVLTVGLPCVHGVETVEAQTGQPELTADPRLERSRFSLSDAGSKMRGELNHSHILSLCTRIHWGWCLYSLIWLRARRDRAGGGRRDGPGRGKQRCLFSFTYVKAGHVWKSGGLICLVFRVGLHQSGCHLSLRATQKASSKWLQHHTELNRFK